MTPSLCACDEHSTGLHCCHYIIRDSVDEEQPFRRLIAGIEGKRPGEPIEITVPGTNPYRGLRAFDVEDSNLFFGREALTGWLLSDIRTGLATRGSVRLLTIVGASGSGKSSLARAGLLARLAAGGIEGSERWRYIALKPGADPLESLTTAGSEALGLGADPKAILNFQDHLAGDARILHTQASLAMRSVSAGARLLLLVDQFEEIFTLCADEGHRRAFIDNLLHAAAVVDGPTVVVLTLRADFLGKCAAYPRLAAVLSDSQELVGPMNRDELRDVIERPAWQAGCEFQPGLVDVLLDDVEAQPGALPLLQHALFDLWRQREGRRLTHDAYEHIGRVKGALARRADEVYQSFTEEERLVTRRLLLRLTQPGEGAEDTRRRAPVAEIVPSAEEAPTVERVVRALADERLLVTEGETVDVAHEALIQGWPKLREWIDQDREGLREHRRLTFAAEEWQRLGRDESGLYHGLRLDQTLAWRKTNVEALNALEREFVDTSVAVSEEKRRESKARRRRRQWFYGGLVTLLSLLLLSTFFFIRMRNDLLKEQAAKQVEAQRTDLSGALTVYASSYGREAQESRGRGLFTATLEKHLFDKFTSVAQAIARTQSVLSGSDQHPEVLSSMNGEVFLNPRNEARRFLGLVAGWNRYDDPWASLEGPVADAQSIHNGLMVAGYNSHLLVNASLDELLEALKWLLNQAREGCVVSSGNSPRTNARGIAIGGFSPCENVLVFVYFAGHGFVHLGQTYAVPTGARITRGQFSAKEFISIEELRGEIADHAAAQVIIADISRNVVQAKEIKSPTP